MYAFLVSLTTQKCFSQCLGALFGNIILKEGSALSYSFYRRVRTLYFLEKDD
jgi:hypothetical protein